MKKIYLFLAAVLTTASYSQVVISQAYGGGNNTGAIYSHDFVELFNRGTTPVSLNGWSIQYGSEAGVVVSGRTPLPDFTLQPGQYYLVQEATNTSGTAPALPSPDLVTVSAGTGIDNPQINMSSTKFKVLLVNTTTVAPSFTDASIVDLLGVGPTTTNFEGTPTPLLSNITAAIRNNGGCTDTNDNGADFTVSTPTPRNSGSPINNCSLSVKENVIVGLNVYPNPVKNGNLYVTSDSVDAKSVIVYDVLGKQVLSSNVINQIVNVSTLKSGVYVVKVMEAGKTATRKLVIE